MGAYNGLGDFYSLLDLGIEKVICNDTVVYPQTVPVKIGIVNGGAY